MLKLVWDTSALINLKENNQDGYSPARSLWKDLADGWIDVPYQNIIPAIAAFEIISVVSQKNRRDERMLYDFWIIGDNEIIYDIDNELIKRSALLVRADGFNKLMGADLIIACIAKLEEATLVTLDKDFRYVAGNINVMDLNKSRTVPVYRDEFPMKAADL